MLVVELLWVIARLCVLKICRHFVSPVPSEVNHTTCDTDCLLHVKHKIYWSIVHYSRNRIICELKRCYRPNWISGSMKIISLFFVITNKEKKNRSHRSVTNRQAMNTGQIMKCKNLHMPCIQRCQGSASFSVRQPRNILIHSLKTCTTTDVPEWFTLQLF